MATDLDPIPGNWYRHLDKGQAFRVIDFDEDAGTVDIEDFDGTVEAVELDVWNALDIEPIEPPEDWSGAFDIDAIDDLGTGITDTTVADWAAPQEELRHPSERDPLIEPEAVDDWGEGAPQEEPWEEAP